MKKPVDYFDSTALRKDLKHKTVRGGLAGAASQVIGTAVGLVSIPVLARLLDPEDFGLVAMVTVFTNFAKMFVEAGLSIATVQRDVISRQQSTNLFWISTLLGLLIGAVVAVGSPAIAWLYGRPELLPITLALTASFLMAGLTIQHQALLTRAMRFHHKAIVGVVAQTIGVGCAIAWAWRYQNQENDYWALVLMPLATALSRMLGVWLVCQWRPGLPRLGVGTRSMITVGAHLTAVKFIGYFTRNADKMLIGWWYGPGQLGLYERAFRLFLVPMQNINAPLAGVMISVLSRLADDPERYRRYYLRAVEKLALVTIPTACFFFSSPEPIVATVLGEGWEAAAGILRVLSILGIAQSIGGTFSWLYISQDRARDQLRWFSMACPALVASFFIGIPWGPYGVALAYSATSLIAVFPLNTLYTCRTGPVAARHVAALFPGPVAVGAATALGAVAGRHIFKTELAVGELAVSMASAALLGITAIAAIPSTRSASGELISLLRLRPRVT